MIFDTLSASITFAVFHSLHFSENMMSEIRDENINFQLIYIYALVAAIVPIFRRRVLREFKLLSYQTGISLAGIAVIVSGLIFRESSWCAWLGNPFLVAIFLWVLVALYGWKTLQES
ncbi:hypothetical protein ATO1_18085 [Phaeobacter sp. 22II1-1F12B]|nr:hypothetical protein ATO1_18085 [Phaeobacter sp. 22II1-1F12B]